MSVSENILADRFDAYPRTPFAIGGQEERTQIDRWSDAGVHTAADLVVALPDLPDTEFRTGLHVALSGSNGRD